MSPVAAPGDRRSTPRCSRASRTPASTPARRRSSAGSTAGWCASRPARPSGRAASTRWPPAACRSTSKLALCQRVFDEAQLAADGAHHAVHAAGRIWTTSSPRAGWRAHRRHAGDGAAATLDRGRGDSRCRRRAIVATPAPARFAAAVGALRGSPLAQRQAHAERLAPRRRCRTAARDRATTTARCVACGQFARRRRSRRPLRRLHRRAARAARAWRVRCAAHLLAMRRERRRAASPTCRSTATTTRRARSIAASASPTATRTTTGRRPAALTERAQRSTEPSALVEAQVHVHRTAPPRRWRPCRGCPAAPSGAPGVSLAKTKMSTRLVSLHACTSKKPSSSVAGSRSGITRTKRSPA